LKGLLIIGGAGPGADVFARCLDGADVVIAADSGYDAAVGLGVEPDLVVGDMDSVRDKRGLDGIPRERRVVYPEDKDETDTEIGLRLLQEKGCTDVVIAGGGGGRIDHLLAIAMLFERERPPSRWVTDREEILLVDGEMEFHAVVGSTISFFPIGAEAAELGSEGLRWPLNGLVLRRGYAGISNRAVLDTVRVRAGRGKLLMVKPLDGVPA
jgi:thiamine pyrophosphokinase